MDTLSTDLLKPTLRFAFWSDVACRTFTMLDCRTADRAGFRANLRSRSIGGVSVARVDATTSSVVRTADLIRSNHDDADIVMLQISGVTRVQQGERSRMMSPGELDVVRAGGKYNFSDVSACIGIAQLAKLESFNRRRRELAARYFELLQEQDGLLLPERGDQDHSWHIFAVPIDYARFGYTRPRLQRALHEQGIGTGVHYPSIPALSFYRQLGNMPERWPNALRIGRETLTLPLFPAMRDEDVERVVKTLWSTLRRD